MKIVIGSLQCEGNSLSPVLTKREDFDYAEGFDILNKLKIRELLEEKGIEVIPTIYAHALPGGAVVKEDFLALCEELLSRIPQDGFDGIWLFLHGTLYVEKIGSGDAYLLRKIREKVGKDIPISLALDFHADNTDELVSLANAITGFRTAPHRDHAETQQRALEHLVTMIERKQLCRPVIERCNVVIPGDAVQTDLEPLKSIMARAREMEKDPDILSAEIFNGHPWMDTPYMGPNFVVTSLSDPEKARNYAKELARLYYDKRYEFKFLIETAEPEEAVRMAMEDAGQVFLSDSGDNTTAGASGDNAFLLNRIIKLGAEGVLIAGIADAGAVESCYSKELGDTVDVQVGGSLDPKSETAFLKGRLIHKGDILSYTGGNEGESVTLDCGKFTVVITKNRACMCRPDIFESVDLKLSDYKIIVVKLGYLFPELAVIARRPILVYTPGSSPERLSDMNLQNIRRPMYPLEDNFM